MPPHRSTHALPPVSLPSLHVSARVFCCHKNTGTSLITFVTISPTSGSKLPFIMNHFLCAYSSCWHDITVTLSFIEQLFSLFFLIFLNLVCPGRLVTSSPAPVFIYCCCFCTSEQMCLLMMLILKLEYVLMASCLHLLVNVCN